MPEVDARDIQHQLATQFFQWTHTRCPSLKILIIAPYSVTLPFGAFTEPEGGNAEPEFSYNIVENSVQQCFVKKVVELDNGTSQITATRVTQSRLRADFPELYILDYDTDTRVADHLA